MYRVKDPVFAMAESSFLDGGSRLDDFDVQALTSVLNGDLLFASPTSFPT